MYTFWAEKKGVATDVISKPYSALVWGAVWGPLFWGGRNVTREGTLFPLLAHWAPKHVLFDRKMKSYILIIGSPAVIVLTTCRDGLLSIKWLLLSQRRALFLMFLSLLCWKEMQWIFISILDIRAIVAYVGKSFLIPLGSPFLLNKTKMCCGCVARMYCNTNMGCDSGAFFFFLIWQLPLRFRCPCA